jgi:hypothetical protein
VQGVVTRIRSGPMLVEDSGGASGSPLSCGGNGSKSSAKKPKEQIYSSSYYNLTGDTTTTG